MKVTSLRDLDFHTPNMDEINKIRKMQRKRRFQSFFKRFLIILLIAMLFVVCQTIARVTVPHRFAAVNTVEVFYTKVTWAFVIANVISWLQLLLVHYLGFNKKKSEIVFVRVNTKYTREYLESKTNKVRELYCECLDEINNVEEQFVEKVDSSDDAIFIDERIVVNGAIDFSNIRKGEEICVERFEDEGIYTYCFVA